MSHRIHDLPEEDRPRERLLRLGAEALSDAELIGIFINTGLPGENAVQMAQRLIRDHGGLRQLSRASGATLQTMKGLGEAKAATLAAAFELGRRAVQEKLKEEPMSSPEIVYELMAHRMQALDHEQVHVLLLNTRMGLLRSDCVFRGGLASTPAMPREILRAALQNNAWGITVVHNHPSGDPTPSTADRQFTRKLDEACTSIGIALVDHVIIGHPSQERELPWFSFHAAGLLISK
jgi:DNA repair protein RadC